MFGLVTPHDDRFLVFCRRKVFLPSLFSNDLSEKDDTGPEALVLPTLRVLCIESYIRQRVPYVLEKARSERSQDDPKPTSSPHSTSISDRTSVRPLPTAKERREYRLAALLDGRAVRPVASVVSKRSDGVAVLVVDRAGELAG